MSNLISPYDLGTLNLVENTQRFSVDELVRNANKVLKKRLVEAQIEALGFSIQTTTTKTKFTGMRLWFVCPCCNKRKGVLFNILGQLCCRQCFALKYRKQRYKGMLER